MLHRYGWKWLSGSLVFASVLAAPTPARAQCQNWAPGFEPNGVDVGVGAMTVFAGGFSNRALYVAGHDRVAWWDADNATWNTIGQPNGDCTAMVAFDDGSGFGRALYLGGWFSQIDGSPNQVHYIARWDGGGWSEVGGGTDFVVFALAVFDDGSGGGPALYAAGEFSTAGGVTVHGIAKWDGVNWSALGNGLPNGDVRALAVFDDGLGSGPALYAGGRFNDASGVPVSNIAKWNGSTWSALGTGIAGAANIVLALAVHDDGTGGAPALYAGGDFTTAGGASANRVAKWDGSTWSALGSGIASGVVRSLASYGDGSGGGAKLYAGGFFDSAGGVQSPRIARWDGSTWSKVGRGTDGEVWALTVFDDGSGPDLYVGGGITRAGSLVASNIARWDGSQWSALGGQGLGPGYPEVHAMKAFDDGSSDGPELYVGGRFHTAGSLSVSNIARWNGAVWSRVGDGIDDFGVRALEIFDDGAGGGPALYAGGFFAAASGVTVNNVAKWDGSSWGALGAGLSGVDLALSVYDDGSGPALYAGGAFGPQGAGDAGRVAHWDGTSWSSVGAGTDGIVRALAVYDDGLGGGPMLCAAGDFDTAGGVSASKVARWDGASWHPLGSGFASLPLSTVHALAVFDDGLGGGPALYAGGETSFGSTGCKIAKWNGTAWNPVCSFMQGYVYSLGVFDDGTGRGNRLYAAGAFTGLDGATASCIARFDGSIWTPVGYGLDNATTALAAFDDGSGAGPDLYAGGYFYQADFHPASSIARFVGCDAPGQAVCFGDGSVVPCPCGNDGAAGRGCENSHGTGGAQIAAAGWTSLANDTLVLTSTGEGSNALSIFLEGGNPGAPHAFGDGLLCAVAPLLRLYTKVASSGTVSAPQAGDASVSARSAASGDALSSGESRSYQVYYRDSNASFCPQPAGDAWNVSSGVRIGWAP